MSEIIIPEESINLIKNYIKVDYKNVCKNLEANVDFGAENQFNLERIEERYERVKQIFNEEQLKNKKILEIGSGSGMLVMYLRKKGIEAFGIEPEDNSLKASEILFEKNGVESCIKKGFGEKLPYSDETFDLIVSFQVLEHTQNPLKVLEECKRVLKKEGIIYFVIPNYHSFWEGHFGLFWLPFLNKKMAKWYVKIFRRNTNFIDNLQFITLKKIKNWSKQLGLEILDLGEKNFKKNLSEERIKKHWTSNKFLGRCIGFLRKTRITRFVSWLFIKFDLYYPIIFIAKKKAD